LMSRGEPHVDAEKGLGPGPERADS
jgi:hypothetical protein